MPHEQRSPEQDRRDEKAGGGQNPSARHVAGAFRVPGPVCDIPGGTCAPPTVVPEAR